MPKFKIGDTVRIRKDLQYSMSEPPGVNDVMIEFRGDVDTVKSLIEVLPGLIVYKLENHSFSWTDDMLEAADDKLPEAEP